MSATYSINPGTPQEANTFNQISDVLNVLPDNTQKLITPRDVRDAVFSNWENTVFRYTKNSTEDEYIGIARSNIKDKIFFGKKELLGSSILSNSVLTALSDVDLFFYNTKSDTAPTQDLKIAFLAGSSQSLHTSSPYLEVVQVSGGTPSLGLNLTHNQTFGGDFNFQAGLNGRVSVNNLVFPSVNELATMIPSASASQAGDLFLVRSNSGYVELRTGGSINTLGSPGGTTNIYGSPVNVNGYSLEFTDLDPTIVPLGGIPAGSTFSNVPLVEMLRRLLYPYLAPLTQVSVTSVSERNHFSNTLSNFTYTLTKRSNDITSSNISVIGNSILANYSGPLVSGPGYISNSYSDSYTFSAISIRNNTTGVFTFSVSATDGIQSYTSSVTETFVYPYFYGFSATNNMSVIQSTVDTDLTKLVDKFRDETVSLAGTGYLYYCYPDYYGSLAKIYDGNGFLLWQSGSASTSWTYSTVNLHSPSGLWGGTQYRVFRTTNMVTIPLPSQNYHFNFTP